MDNFNYDDLKQQEEDYKNKKAWVNVLGAIGQDIANAPTMADLMLGRKTDNRNIKGLADSVSSSMTSPFEDKLKELSLQKSAAEAKSFGIQKDPNSNASKAAKLFYSQKGLAVNPDDSAYDLAEKYGKQSDLVKESLKSQDDLNRQIAVENQKLKNDKELKNYEKGLAGNSNKKQFENLPKDRQEIITDLSKKNASKIAISNQIDSVMKNWDNLNDDQKIMQGRQLIKVLNSTEGADAVGSEEAKRLGGKLEFALGNLTNSNPFQLGRDLDGFKEQATLTSQGIKNAVKANQEIVDGAYGRSEKNSPVYDFANSVDPNVAKKEREAKAILALRAKNKKSNAAAR